MSRGKWTIFKKISAPKDAQQKGHGGRSRRATEDAAEGPREGRSRRATEGTAEGHGKDTGKRGGGGVAATSARCALGA